MTVLKGKRDVRSLPKSCPKFAQHRENFWMLIADYQLKRVAKILLYRYL